LKFSAFKRLAGPVVGGFVPLFDVYGTPILIPNFEKYFNITFDSSQLIVSVFLFTLLCSVPLSGWLNDRIGVSKSLLAGLAIVTFGALIAGYSKSFNVFLLSRLIEGVGAGICMPTSLTILTKNFTHDHRGEAIGWWGGAVSMAPIVSPAVIHVIEFTQTDTNFYAVVAVLGAMAFFTFYRFKETDKDETDSNTKPFDYVGYVLLLAFFCAIYIPTLPQVMNHHYEWLGISLCLALVLLVIIVKYVLPRQNAIIPIELFSFKTYRNGLLLTSSRSMLVVSSNFIVPVFLQTLLSFSLNETSALMSMQAIVIVIFTPIIGRYADKFDSLRLAGIGFVLMAVCHVLLSMFDQFWFVVLCIVLRALALGLVTAPVIKSTMREIPKDLAADASSTLNLFQRLFGVLGVVALSGVYSFVEQDSVGMTYLLYFISAVSGIVALMCLKRKPQLMN